MKPGRGESTSAPKGGRIASPWDALLLAPRSRRLVAPASEGGATEARPGTNLSRLLGDLATRPGGATTLSLAMCADLTLRQVWGLLKQPRAIGQVRFDAGRWSLVAGFAGRDVERAAALLRERGWRVEPPIA